MNILKLANEFFKLADNGENTPVDKLSYAQISTYMQSAGLTFAGESDNNTIGFVFNQIKYRMMIVSDSYIRFATSNRDEGIRMWEVPNPQKTVQRNNYFGKDMPLILKLITNTLKADQAHPSK